MLVKCNEQNLVIENFKIRKIVFIEEQNVSYEEEYDLIDNLGDLYLWKNQNNQFVSCCRTLYYENFVIIGRVATLKEYRHLGYGKAMLEAVIEEIKQRGSDTVIINAQLTSIPFYETLGFKASGDIFLDANIKHRRMTKLLTY